MAGALLRGDCVLAVEQKMSKDGVSTLDGSEDEKRRKAQI